MKHDRKYNLDADPTRTYWWSEESGGMMGWADIGKEIGTTGERARQIYRGAIYKLRRNPEALRLFLELCKDK
jgi:DNA-directed RNA polymerase sigma subunit (sigma70/sigma32)